MSFPQSVHVNEILQCFICERIYRLTSNICLWWVTLILLMILNCYNSTHVFLLKGLPRWQSGKEPAWQCRRVLSLGGEESSEEELAAHSSILAWEMPWTEERVWWATVCEVAESPTWLSGWAPTRFNLTLFEGSYFGPLWILCWWFSYLGFLPLILYRWNQKGCHFDHFGWLWARGWWNHCR